METSSSSLAPRWKRRPILFLPTLHQTPSPFHYLSPRRLEVFLSSPVLFFLHHQTSSTVPGALGSGELEVVPLPLQK